MKNKNKGFTLVELLAVIVILAIILVIAVPKVMSIIDDSKRATLENTVKMIASSAEKAKIQNAVLGNDEEITCESITNINDVDYANCEITFDNNTAKVTIKGSGKFVGLNVCKGTKNEATSTNEICPIEYGIGTTYIKKLLEEEKVLKNGLIVDDTEDQNIRYAGSLDDIKNKVYFNCKDKDSNNVDYGQELYDYANSCEVWRIVGIFEVDNGSGKIEKRIKIIRDAFKDSNGYQIGMSYDSSIGGENIADSVNYGYGINQWGESTYEDGTYYEGSDVMRMLNGYYLGKDGATCTYCNGEGQANCSNDCTKIINPLSNTALSMLENALWHLGGQTWEEPFTVTKFYANERGVMSGKICPATSLNNGKLQCNDTVTRTTSWVGKIGLIYPSDFGYASTDESCSSNIYGNKSTCLNNNWLYTGNYYLTMTPYASYNAASSLWSVSPSNNVSILSTYGACGVRPTLYLVSSVQIVGGDGDKEPYILAI